VANMSYCYFRNTRRDMNDCLDALRDEKSLSAVEVHAGRNMFLEILEFCQEQGIVDAFDDEMVRDLFAERQDHEEAEDDEEPF